MGEVSTRGDGDLRTFWRRLLSARPAYADAWHLDHNRRMRWCSPTDGGTHPARRRAPRVRAAGVCGILTRATAYAPAAEADSAASVTSWPWSVISALRYVTSARPVRHLRTTCPSLRTAGPPSPYARSVTSSLRVVRHVRAPVRHVRSPRHLGPRHLGSRPHSGNRPDAWDGRRPALDRALTVPWPGWPSLGPHRTDPRGPAP